MFIAILLKLLTTAYLILVNWEFLPSNQYKDASYYLHTSKQIATKGTYSLYNSPDGAPLPYAGRLPGYDVVLAPLFLVFQEARTVAVVAIILQLLLACISLYYLHRLMLRFIPHGWISAILLWLYAVNVFTGMYDIMNLTESFSVTALIIGLALVLDYRTKRELLFGSLFLLWAYLLRPPVLPICLMALAYPLWQAKKLNLSWAFLPFVLFTVLWVGRNYIHFNRIIPVTSDLHAGYNFPEWFIPTMELLQTWGGDIMWWREGSEMRVFIFQMHKPSEFTCEEALARLPKYVITKNYPGDSICLVRQLIASGIEGDTVAIKEAVKLLSNLKADFIENSPYHYHISSRFRLLGSLLTQSGTQFLYNKPFHELNPFESGYKAMHFIAYFAILLLGIIGACFSIYRMRVDALIIGLGLIFILLVFPLVLRRIEFRYIIHLIPLAYVLSGYCLLIISGFLKNRFPFLQHQGSLESKSNS